MGLWGLGRGFRAQGPPSAHRAESVQGRGIGKPPLGGVATPPLDGGGLRDGNGLRGQALLDGAARLCAMAVGFFAPRRFAWGQALNAMATRSLDGGRGSTQGRHAPSMASRFAHSGETCALEETCAPEKTVGTCMAIGCARSGRGLIPWPAGLTGPGAGGTGTRAAKRPPGPCAALSLAAAGLPLGRHVRVYYKLGARRPLKRDRPRPSGYTVTKRASARLQR